MGSTKIDVSNWFQYQPDVESVEPLSVEVAPGEVVAVGKATSPRSQALRQLHTAAFEPLVEQTQDGVAQAKTETQEAKVTKLTSKATKVSVRQGNQFGVSLLQSSLCRAQGLI